MSTKVAVTYGLIPICGNRNILIFGVKLQVWSNIKINTSKLCMTRVVLGDGGDTSLKEQLLTQEMAFVGKLKHSKNTNVWYSYIVFHTSNSDAYVVENSQRSHFWIGH